jgi:hypothetical protein
MARTPIAVPIPKRALERNAMPRINAGHARCCPIQDTVGAQKPRPSGGVSPASAAAACLTTNKTLQTGMLGWLDEKQGATKKAPSERNSY